MLTEIEHNKNLNRITYACLLYLYQAEIDAFSFTKDGISVYEQCKINFAIDDVKRSVSEELGIIFSAGEGLCRDGANQYTEFTNAIYASMPDFVNLETAMAVLSYQLHIYCNEVGKTKIAKRAAKLYSVLTKYIELNEFNRSLKEVCQSTKETMIEYLGTYQEQLEALKEYQYDTARIL